MIIKDNVIEILLVGNTGVGKSELILSFIDEKEKQRIPASDFGQTTRVSMEYSIFFNTSIESVVEISFKTKKEFIDERMDKLYEYFNDIKNKVEYFKKEQNVENNINKLKRHILHDSAFFDCKEFGQITSNEIENIFNNRFNKEFWDKVDDNYFDNSISNTSLDDNNNKFNPNAEFEKYFEVVYDIITNVYKTNSGKESMEKVEFKLNNNNIDLQPYLKTKKDKLSYSSIVKKIIFNVNGKEQFKNTLINSKIDMIKFIDTYGIGHDKPYGEEELRLRYDRLLRKEYPNINDVFFLWTTSSPDSPKNTAESLPIIYSTRPNIMSFIIFTKIDEVSSKYFSDEFKPKEEIEKIKEDIVTDLSNEAMNKELAEFKLNVMVNNVCGYASKISENCVLEKEKMVLKENEKIFTLFKIIRNKEYLVDEFIPVNKLTVYNMHEILDVNNLFESHDINSWLPGRTKWAVHNRFCSNELGFWGKYNTTYSNYYESDLNKRFANIKNVLNLNDDIFKTITQLFADFANTLSRNSSDYISALDNSSYSKMIISILYNNRKNEIEEFKKSKNYFMHLDEVFNFGKLDNEQINLIQSIIDKAYEEIFLGKCREHNARLLAKKLNDDTTTNEEEKLFIDYYDRFDNLISDDEKEGFEEMVANYSN
ncbi:MAG: hypothetical protein J6M39_07380 [Lachnospiraceae bacterium]|nr:hypothetical protein [Lachnospiraceae bacterium]